jgi:hypothetical protein
MPERFLRRLLRPAALRVLLCAALLAVILPVAARSAERHQVFLPLMKKPSVYGVLQPKAAYEQSSLQAGLTLRTLEIGWRTYEPRDGVFNQAYIDEQRATLARMRAAGFQVVLDLGVQYPPDWVLARPNSRFVNQHGEAFAGGQGINGVNAVFNQELRDLQARYARRVFADLGVDFYAVRLGWGYFNELKYPPAEYNGRANLYWAFDPIAQGRAPGLPPGMRPAPRPGWQPGTPSADHADAAAFVAWYLGSLEQYHDWQLATVRASYPGRLMMLYPSWGLRPGQVEAAVAGDLGGTTPAEVNGELQRGLDFARLVEGTRDPLLVLYTTWLDAPDEGDGGDDPARWSPARYLSALARAHPLNLGVWGENSGRNSERDMARCLRQVQANGLQGMFWAFEPDLYGDQYASLQSFVRLRAELAAP